MRINSVLCLIGIALLIFSGCVSSKKYKVLEFAIQEKNSYISEKEKENNQLANQIVNLKSEKQSLERTILDLEDSLYSEKKKFAGLSFTLQKTKDSLSLVNQLSTIPDKYLYQKGDSAQKETNYKQAILYYDYLLKRKNNNSTYRRGLKKMDQTIKLDSAQTYIEKASRSKGIKAIEYYDKALSFHNDKHTVYLKARAYGSFDKEKAVIELKKIKSGYQLANEFYDQINPIKTRRGRFLYSLCWDGTRSSSTGRGTCSHHGGVRETVYAEIKYREY